MRVVYRVLYTNGAREEYRLETEQRGADLLVLSSKLVRRWAKWR